MAETGILELDKTLQVDGQTYNINAKTAEVADSVANKLILKKTNLDGTTSDKKSDWTEFDGSSEVALDIVPASGGGFKGRVTVPDFNNQNMDPKALLNSNDIKRFIVNELMSNSVLATWDGTNLSEGGDGSSVKSVCIITGRDSDKNSFASKNNKSYLAYKNNDTTKTFISAFIYISTDTGNLGNIYFGTCEAAEVTGVQVNADNANTAGELASSQHFSVSLESSAEVDFNGTNAVALGVTGTLPINKGGTGAVTAAEARAKLGITATNLGAATSDHTHLYAGSSAVGGTANRATADANGNVISTYYQPKILTGTVDPATSTVAAVKNAPNGAIYIKY